MAPGIPWAGDFEPAVRQALTHHQLLLVHFWMSGRPMCEAMDQQTLSQPAVVAATISAFVAVKVDAGIRPQLFDQLIGGRGGLATAVVDPQGMDVVSARLGFIVVDDFVRFLANARAGHPKLKAARLAAQRHPWDPAALLQLAEVYEALASQKRSEESFSGIVKLGGAAPEAMRPWRRAVAISFERLARFAVLRGRNQEALQHAAAYRELDPGNDKYGRLDRIVFTEALALAVERRMSAAVVAFGVARSTYPTSVDADHLLFALGMAQHELGQDPAAVTTFQTLISRFPESGWAPVARVQLDHVKHPQPDHQH